MAIYMCRVRNITRKAGGRSAISAAAYRAGEELHDKESGETWKYNKKEVADSKIFLPENAPAAYKDRETLWNSVQKVEKQSNARLAREFVVAVPNEFDKEQAARLLDDFSQYLAEQGMCVDRSLHWKDGNHHGHIMCSTRKIEKDGSWAKYKERKVLARDKDGNKIPLLDENGNQKVRIREGKGVEKLWKRVTVEANEWNKKEKCDEWKAQWATLCNRELERFGSAQRLDSRSYEEQGIPLIPQVHEGYAARAIEKRGGTSFLCEHNREVRALNKSYLDKISELDSSITDFKKQKAEREKVTICGFLGLDKAQRLAVSKKVNPILKGLQKAHERRFPEYKNKLNYQADFFKNAVFAKTKNGVHLLPMNKDNAIKNGLLDKAGGAKDFSKAQLKDVAQNIKGVAKDIFSVLDDKMTSKDHLKKVKENVVEILKTPPKAIADIIKNPVTGILSLLGKLLSMISKAASAGIHAGGAVAKGGSMSAGSGRAPTTLGFGKFPKDWNLLNDDEKERIIAEMEQEEMERWMGGRDYNTPRAVAPPPPAEQKQRSR